MADDKREIEELNMALESFYRRSAQERNRRQNAFGFHFDTEENRRFSDEMNFLKSVEFAFLSLSNLLLENGKIQEFVTALEKEIVLIPITKESVYFSDLKKGEILWYLLRKNAFLDGEGDAGDLYALELYLLELANLSGGIQPEQALEQMVKQFQSGKKYGVDQNRLEDFFLRICQSFLISNPQLVRKMKQELLSCGLYWKWDLAGSILEGKYEHAADFVRKHAKGLKEEEWKAEKDFQKAAWSALPIVFVNIEKTFSEKERREKGLFDQILTIGNESKRDIDLLPVCRRRMGQKRRVLLSETAAFDYKMNYGKQAEECWLLSEAEFCDGAREFLTIIYRYTESFLREAYGAAKRKRSADRFLKKKFARSEEHPRVIRSMKVVLMDSRFENAILQGVREYLSEHPAMKKPVAQKETAREKAKKKLDAMDHEEVGRRTGIDVEAFRKVRKEADQIMSLFQDGTIDYQE